MANKTAKNSPSANGAPTIAGRSRTRVVAAVIVSLILGAAWRYRVTQAISTDRRSAHRAQATANLEGTTSLNVNTSIQSPSDEVPISDSEPKSDTNDVSIQNAQALIDRGLVQEGAAMLEKIIDADPSNTQALMEMAMVYTLDLKEPQKSRQLLERIIDINPQHRAALNELELLYKELDSVEDGLALLAQKAEQYPESLEIQYVYGRMLATSDPTAAIPWLQRATFIADQKEQALDQLAAAALRSGNVALAVKSWAEALTLAETELERAKANGESGLDYLEDRVTATKMELSKAKAQLHNTTRQ